MGGDGPEEDPEDRAKRECGEPKPLKLIVKAIPAQQEGENGASGPAGHLHPAEERRIPGSAIAH